MIKNQKKYNENLIRRSIVVFKHTTNEKLRQSHQMFIFDSCEKIIERNVNNFFNLIKDIERGQVIHEPQDIRSECFIILERCLHKFDLSNKEFKFYFYLNKALSKGLFRIKEKNYDKKGKYDFIPVEDAVKYTSKTFCLIKTHPLFLDKIFSNKEILLMQSKLNEEKIDDICKNLEIPKNEYYALMKSIKEKINTNYL